MAKASDKAQPDDSVKKKRKGASVLVWVLMAMLVAGLGGFGVTNFGSGMQSIGSVGDRDMTVNDYARSLQQELQALSAQFGTQIPLSQAMTLGLDQRVLQGLVNRTALDAEAERIGLSVGDAVVASQVQSMPAFQGTAGSFDRDTYRLALQQNNMTESEFERGLRADLSRQLLQGAVMGGFSAPVTLTDTVHAWASERRGFSLLRLTEADLTSPLPAPTDADLQAFYDAHIADFTRPEAKRISYAALLPEDLAPEMPVDETALRALYDERIDEFVVPERRLVERLAFATEEDAAAAKARFDQGVSFEQLVTDRGLALEDIDMGDVSAQELGAAGEAVFALAGPGVVGPFTSDIGPALFRMNGVLEGSETTFEAARESLAAELRTDAARRAIADKIEAIDDLLVGGATLADLAKEQGLTLGTTDYRSGDAENDAIAAYPDFRKAADALAAGDFPEAILLDDGGVVAMELTETVPAAPIPLDEAREAVSAAWRAEALDKALSAQAATVKTALDGGAELGSFGIVEVTTAALRDSFLENVPEDLMTQVFQMAPGEVRVIERPGFVGLVRLDSVTPADFESEDAAAIRDAIASQAAQGMSSDAFELYTNALTAKAGIRLDQTAIAAVHAQFN